MPNSLLGSISTVACHDHRVSPVEPSQPGHCDNPGLRVSAISDRSAVGFDS